MCKNKEKVKTSDYGVNFDTRRIKEQNREFRGPLRCEHKIQEDPNGVDKKNNIKR